MKLKSLLSEMTVSEVPSVESGIDYPLNKEFSEMKESIQNYAKKTTEQFKQTLMSKVQGKHISISGNDQVEPFIVSDIIIGNDVTFITKENKKITYSEGDILIHNDQEIPVTATVQSTSQPSDTPNKIKQF